MKQISSRFSVAVHILSLIAVSPKECTGDFIAGSVNTNPVIIRKIMGNLKKAGLVDVRLGVGGASLLKAPDEITLLDVYRAVDVVEEGQLFYVHGGPSPDCPVGPRCARSSRKRRRPWSGGWRRPRWRSSRCSFNKKAHHELFL